ncbi:uncharacterized protein P174DRAFT_472022 [Aspergillus novofumigatus IBT 16806]|uniref:Uncharacterized protein n=1 Tax=Aspergillus novofumigatus (strain IBT 16806) TaxID=1392255 RepID=A0A2I1BUT7_ASPN1|nr:uncharacterized protein P174DRAFT_472022 [Aspergillus novofumigatus IBT 16806]PKX89129.1 hypothetical protein P174DRAFT_472022 [Aspergillus novofumigatus IBT 16806]
MSTTRQPGASRLSARWADLNGACACGNFRMSTQPASPQIMLYAASVWYAPPARGRKRLHSQQTKVSNRIQRRAGKLIAGAFRTVSGAAFNAELHLTPTPLLLRQRRIQTFIRIATTPAYRMHILDRRRHHRNALLHSPLEAAEEEVELATGSPRPAESLVMSLRTARRRRQQAGVRTSLMGGACPCRRSCSQITPHAGPWTPGSSNTPRSNGRRPGGSLSMVDISSASSPRSPSIQSLSTTTSPPWNAAFWRRCELGRSG